MWIIGTDRYYNERTGYREVLALAREYQGFSLPSAAKYHHSALGTFPDQPLYDVFSDSMYVMPRLQNYAENTERYFELVAFYGEGDKKK